MSGIGDQRPEDVRPSWKIFASYDHLSQPLQSALREIEQLIAEVDGQTLAIPTENGCFIDNGIIVAGDMADSFNTIVAALTKAEGR